MLKSILVLRRFALKIGFFVCVAAIQAAVGNGFVRHLVSLALASAVLAIAIGHWRLERVNAPHYTYFDEAAWFMLVSIIGRNV